MIGVALLLDDALTIRGEPTWLRRAVPGLR